MNEKLRNSEFALEIDRGTTVNIAPMVISAYTAAIIGAEAIGVFGNFILGALFDAILILVLLNHYAAIEEQASYRRLLPALALLPLLRLLSLILPIKEVPEFYWNVIVGIPLLLAAALTAHVLGLSWSDLGLSFRPSWLTQIAIALSGVPLSLAGFLLLLRPQPMLAALDWRAIASAEFILFLFSGFTEEIIFRGILQQVARQALGSFSVVYSSVMFATLYMGSLSLSYVVFIGLVGLFFGWCVNRTGSIWGVVLAHTVLNIGMLLIWPLML